MRPCLGLLYRWFDIHDQAVDGIVRQFDHCELSLNDIYDPVNVEEASTDIECIACKCIGGISDICIEHSKVCSNPCQKKAGQIEAELREVILQLVW